MGKATGPLLLSYLLKLALVHKALSPQYPMDRQRLWSSIVALCKVLRTCRSPDIWSITVVVPHLWNILPLHLHNSELTLLQFRRLLKMHVFCWRPRHLLIVAFRAPYICTYLLTYSACCAGEIRPDKVYHRWGRQRDDSLWIWHHWQWHWLVVRSDLWLCYFSC